MKIISYIHEEENIISIEEAKRYLRISGNFDDELIEELVKSSISYGESFIKLNISKKKIIFSTKLVNQKIYFPYLPVYSLVSLKLLASKKTKQKEQVLDEDDYSLQKDFLFINSRHVNRNIEVEYITGLDIVSPNIIQALKMYLLLLYDKEEITYTKLMGIHTLLNPHRLIQI